ncbi:MAG: GGDEF domain-containing protein [Planctomycetota bacterium]|nr:MAG: GGDEF domain-containing protein [Planctomycetota bacterium]
MATHSDPLRGLLSRSFFEQALAPWLDRVRVPSLGVVVFDIDRFKAVNDTHGHDVGDLALQTVARAASHFQRPDANTWVLRWGGEEFVAVCCGATLEETSDIAEQLRRRVAEQDVRDAAGSVFRVTVTCGVAHWPTTIDRPDRPGSDFHALLRQADLALYEGKRAGRNRVVAFEGSKRTEEGGFRR